jgi:hypothetical protein
MTAIVIAVNAAAAIAILAALAAIMRHGHRAASGHHDGHAELLRMPQRAPAPDRRAA